MSATGLDVFDKTLQTTNIWLDEIMSDIGPDRKTAWRVLAVVLHRLRNRLPIGVAAHLGAQLPMMVRGVYYDQFQPEQLPSDCDTMEQFCAEVAEWLQDNRPVDPELAVKSVFRVLANHVSEGEIGHVVQALPEQIREAWPQEARDSAQRSGQNEPQSSQQQSGAPNQQHNQGRRDQQPAGQKGDKGAMFGKQDKPELEPASPRANQTMVGGTDGSGPAR